MSRCFPYPPPGYVLSRARNEALIESIKLQEEKRRKEEKRLEKKERRKEKKEKRKEKKERKKEKKDKTNHNLDKSDTTKKSLDGQKICSDEVESLHKRSEAEIELERSSLTEEHGHLVSFPSPTSSSDSTQNSNKRKRHSSSIDASHGHGKVILIRMSSKKDNEFDTLAKEQQPCSTSGRTDDTGPRNGQENFRCTPKGKNGIKSVANAVANPMQRMEVQYQNLVENLVRPGSQDSCLYSDNLDWLFKNQDIRAEKKQRSGSDTISSCSRSSAMWPPAEFLVETGLHVLPFTVPY